VTVENATILKTTHRQSAFAAAHAAVPLPFDVDKLDGLSRRMVQSHWENNYIASVKGLNILEARLATALRDEAFPPLIYGTLKREEALRTGSIVLHEHYFANLGGDGKPCGTIVAALESAFGTHAQWERDFRRTALSLAGASGWCSLTLNTHTGCLQNVWASDHLHAVACGVPLLVLDMYEHAYQIDYGAGAAEYVDACFRNFAWDQVERRYLRASAKRTI
jgi:Fe-Mn family superoxide dismutase